MRRDPPLLGFAAYSGTGKTELLTRLIPLLTAHGLRVGALKHAHHDFDVDQPGKDSYRLRKAGAQEVLVSSSRRHVLIRELEEGEKEPGLGQLLEKLCRDNLDLVLVEGFKREAFPKIELHRPSLGHPYLYPDDSNIIALATDAEVAEGCPLPHLDLNQPQEIVEFIRERILSQASHRTPRTGDS